VSLHMPTRDSQQSNFYWIDLVDFEIVCFKLARKHYTFNEPIPDLSKRNPGILESCLETPIQQFGGKEVYKTFESKLSILFYLLIKNHPLQNGNKRAAFTTLLVTMFLNKRWLDVGDMAIYKLAKEVASSLSKDKDKILKRIESFIKRHQIKVNP